MPNRLANESSPYLLQHQNNPVDWSPWDAEAIERARTEQKPIFLSIGYSACHWCHVMEHESFENDAIAKTLNEHFVCIKVDREERPDLDQIYMNAVQMLTGRGGWPMSVFLTPELKPFYGGTYWPPTASRQMPGFDQVLAAVHDAWTNRRDEIDKTADQITSHLDSVNQTDGEEVPLTLDLLTAAGQQLEKAFDPVHGGFGAAPKFPHSMDMQVLLRLYARDGRQAWLDMVERTLDRMIAGGIYDHLGGGFARYSVDARWLVPHFEKMLYDNALLTSLLVETYQVTQRADYEATIRQTLDYVLRDMTDTTGLFYSTEDADSLPSPGHVLPEGPPPAHVHAEEGLFYTWTPHELAKVLGSAAAETFAKVYQVTPAGNFEGRSILNLPRSVAEHAKELGRELSDLEAELADSRARLLVAREERVRPGLDDKVLTSWNGLMIDAMARAGAVLNEPRYLKAAQKAADAVLEHLRSDDEQLLHTWRHGKAKLQAYLDDYASLSGSLVTLFETTAEQRFLDEAVELVDTVLEKFADRDDGKLAGFFFTADDHEALVTRNKELTDNATPGGNSLMASVLLRLGKLIGRAEYLDAAEATLQIAAPLMKRAPMAMGLMLCALDFRLGPTHELVLVGDADGQLIHKLQSTFLPRTVIAMREEASTGGVPSQHLEATMAGKRAIDGQQTLYVCQNQTCGKPAVGAEEITTAITQLATPEASRT